MACAYEATERVRLLLHEACEPELASASRVLAEAAYYLSDTMDPDNRLGLLGGVESKLAHAEPTGDSLPLEALETLGGVCDELRRLLRGRHASAELRIALQALSRVVCDLALYAKKDASSTSSRRLKGDRSVRGLALRHAAP